MAQPGAILRQVIRDGRVGLKIVYDRKQQVFGLQGAPQFVQGVGAVNSAEPALRRHRGQRRGDVQAGVPLPGVGINAPAELEHVGMGAVGGGDLLQLIVGIGVIAQTNPAIGRAQWPSNPGAGGRLSCAPTASASVFCSGVMELIGRTGIPQAGPGHRDGAGRAEFS